MTKAVIFSGPEKGPEINAALVDSIAFSKEMSGQFEVICPDVMYD